jgi:tRNA1(Val) A37 N6-methylase TrmN6
MAPRNNCGAGQTHGHLLAGRVSYAQPAEGFRSGLEPVLLAAAIPARPGARILEGGSGAGATLLCLAARVPGIAATGLERDPLLVGFARHNAATNSFSALRFVAGDITALPALGEFEHACANPPYHAGDGTPSPNPSRRAAKHGGAGLMSTWAAALAMSLRRWGTLTFILAAARMPEALAAFDAAGCTPVGALPLWPRPGVSAKLLLLRGVKGSRAPFRVLPGLVLHTPGGRFTEEVDAILRGGAALDF